MKILITGAAGFIGAHLINHLSREGHDLVGLDNLNSYYDVRLKRDRLKWAQKTSSFDFHKLDLLKTASVQRLIKKVQPDRVIHLAAQAGVRYSTENPQSYVDSNLVGFMNLLEACRQARTPHFIYASTSSIYGLNEKLPFSEKDPADHPASLYAATKRANELLAHSYSHMYQLPTTGLRFFTVYGPWGRPDMSLFLFTKAILEEKPIDVFNEGQMRRDFTYIDDIVSGVSSVTLGNLPRESSTESPDRSTAPFRIYNIGNSHPENLLRYIEVIESCIGKKAIKSLKPMFRGDVKDTYADTSSLAKDFGYQSTTSIERGVKKFVEWYRTYYNV